MIFPTLIFLHNSLLNLLSLKINTLELLAFLSLLYFLKSSIASFIKFKINTTIKGATFAKGSKSLNCGIQTMILYFKKTN